MVLILWQKEKVCRRNTPKWDLKRGGRLIRKQNRPGEVLQGVEQPVTGVKLWHEEEHIGELQDVHILLVVG